MPEIKAVEGIEQIFFFNYKAHEIQSAFHVHESF